jgi:hypothetical protein
MSVMARRVASLIATAILVAALGAGGPGFALGDGDPASDVLLGQNVYYPYSPPVPKSVQDTLNAETAAAKKAGLPIKVALIATAVDLGVIPELFEQPQNYAKFLDKEISFNGPQPLLVVMPAGYGVQSMSAKAEAAIKGLAPPKGKTSTALAQAAITAVAKIAAADGHPVKGVAGVSTGSSGGGSSTAPLLIGLIVAAVLVAGGLIALRRRQGTASAAG